MRRFPIGLCILLATSASAHVTGKWDTARELELTLSANGRFSMGSRRGDHTGGTWKRAGNTIKLKTTILRGQPIDDVLTRRFAKFALPMSPSQRASGIAVARTALDITLEVSGGEKTLIWRSNGRQEVFSRARKHPIELIEGSKHRFVKIR